MSEYDARSKPATPKFRDNYDVIFKNAKADREKRAKERQEELLEDCGGTGNRYELTKP